jgi:uncharacterized membrane protein YbhN (UPF0104 family)
MAARMARTVARWTRRPGVFLPVLLGGVLVLALLALGNVHDVLTRLHGFQQRYLLAFAAVALLYEAVRCAQWGYLLTALGLRVPGRRQVFTYVTGEVMKSMPVGNFFPDYVLQRSQGTEFGLASSVTLAINLLEVAVTLVGLVALGVPGWSWLRPLIVFGLAGFALLVWLLTRWRMRAGVGATRVHLPRRLAAQPAALRARDELRHVRAGSSQILRPRVLMPAALLSAVYLVLGGLGLALLAWGLGLHEVTLGQAMAVYFFSLAFATIIPVPMDLGSTELGGVGVLLAMGVSKSAAVGIMLLDRTLALGVALGLALVVGLVLQAEVRAEVRAFLRGHAPAEPKPLAEPQDARADTHAPGLAAAGESPAPAWVPDYIVVASCTTHVLDAAVIAAGTRACAVAAVPPVCWCGCADSEGHRAA